MQSRYGARKGCGLKACQPETRVVMQLLSQHRGEFGVLKHLACFFKSPMGVNEPDFFKQMEAMLQEAGSRQEFLSIILDLRRSTAQRARLEKRANPRPTQHKMGDLLKKCWMG